MFNRSSLGVGNGKKRINLVTDRSAPKSYKVEPPLYRHSLMETMDTFFLANQQIDIKSTSLMRTLHCQLFAVINRSFFMVKKFKGHHVDDPNAIKKGTG